VTSVLWPHKSPSSSAMPCISKNISIERDIVLIYELGICMALTSGHACINAKMSLFDVGKRDELSFHFYRVNLFPPLN
jgi:hypothetical protein